MGTNIVLCSDGTGNSTIKNRGTNVYKVYEAVDIVPSAGEARQIAFYDDGVGTGSTRYLRAFGGAFGFGFARNLRDLYMSLARVYQPGDSIYLFGFSRGAYTVRGVAGLIATCGIVSGSSLSEDELRRAVNAAYRVYRLGYRPDTERNRADARARAEEFRREHVVYEPGAPVRIAFIGVWDTVGAVGFPDGTWPKRILWVLSGYRVPWFKNYHLSPIVDRACHAHSRSTMSAARSIPSSGIRASPKARSSHRTSGSREVMARREMGASNRSGFPESTRTWEAGIRSTGCPW